MRTYLLVGILLVHGSNAIAQWQANPQVGINFQQITKAPVGVEYSARAGYFGGVDFRSGGRLYVQPGVFVGRSATMYRFADATVLSGNILRTSLKPRLMMGYRVVDHAQFDIRLSVGPSYDFVLDRSTRNPEQQLNDDDFNDGLWGADGAVGFDFGRFTIEYSLNFGLSRVYTDNLVVQNIDSRYITYAITIGVNLGDDHRNNVPVVR